MLHLKTPILTAHELEAAIIEHDTRLTEIERQLQKAKRWGERLAWVALLVVLTGANWDKEAVIDLVRKTLVGVLL